MEIWPCLALRRDGHDFELQIPHKAQHIRHVPRVAIERMEFSHFWTNQNMLSGPFFVCPSSYLLSYVSLQPRPRNCLALASLCCALEDDYISILHSACLKSFSRRTRPAICISNKSSTIVEEAIPWCLCESC